MILLGIAPFIPLYGIRRHTANVAKDLKECHPRCVYQHYNGLIINNGSQKHN